MSTAGPTRPAVRVTVAQLSASADHAANREVVSDAFRTAQQVHADLVVFPEYTSGFEPAGVGIAHAEPVDGPFVALLRARAAETGVAVIAGTTLPGTTLPAAADGVDAAGATPAAPDRAVNAVVAVDGTGELVGIYRKVHLYDAFGHRESDRLEPGPADAEPLVLDNLIPQIRPASQRQDLLPVYAFNAEGLWLPGPGGGKRSGSSKQLSRWQDLLTKMRGEGLILDETR